MKRIVSKIALIATALLALSACGMARSTDVDVAAQPASTPSASSASTPAPKQAPAKPPAGATPSPQAPTASLPQPSPDQLMGLDAQGVTRLLGQPSLKRTEGPANVWQYANRLCVLDVVMYDEEGKSRVSYVELRDPLGGNAVPRNCFRSFLKNPPDGGA